MAAQCRSGGGGPWAFGADLAGKPISVADDQGPFAKALARTTSWSDRVYSVELSLPIAEESVGKAQEKALIAALKAAGWTSVEMAGSLDIGMLLNESNYILMPPGVDDPATAPIFAGVSWFPSRLRLTCISADWVRRDRKEMDGQLPEDAQRPAAMSAITATRPTNDRCADPANVANIEAMFGNDVRDDWADQSARQSQQTRRIETWMRWKLLQSGKVSEEQLWALEDRAAAPDREDPGANLIQGMEMLALLPEIQAAKAKRDKAKLCPLYVRLIDFMALEDERQMDRWERIEPLLLAEAEAAGVDLSR
ncbi:MAG: hypothetical protein HC788_03670 [Sphingopyxis sp.]|nr:hypothetical protein [Sphingopyxis sp.]